jgi:hypothetical protein
MVDAPPCKAAPNRSSTPDPDILAWTREGPQDRLLATVNFTATSAALP